jgi:chorismate mutase
MSVAHEDPIVQQLRDQVSELDRRLIATVNERLEVVAALWRHKREHGLPLSAPDREEWLLRFLSEANAGPLSDAGLARLHAFVLALTKEELADE